MPTLVIVKTLRWRAQGQTLAAQQTEQLVALLEQDTQLTALTRQMSERIEALTLELCDKITASGGSV